MRRKLFFIVILSSLLFFHSCKEKGIIPKDVMSDIYYDMYMNDQEIKSRYIFRRMSDTLHIYAPIFEKYGYTTEDYMRSIEYYLIKPEELEKIFKKTLNNLEKRKSTLDALIAAEEKRALRWEFIDSLELYTADTIQSSNYYRALRMMFFKPDSVVPTSPIIDSVFMKRSQNVFTLFSDSVLKSDDNFKFYKSLGIFPALPPKDTLDSLSVNVSSIDTEPEQIEKEKPEIIRNKQKSQQKSTINPATAKDNKRQNLRREPSVNTTTQKGTSLKVSPKDTGTDKRRARSKPTNLNPKKETGDSTLKGRQLDRNKKKLNIKPKTKQQETKDEKVSR